MDKIKKYLKKHASRESRHRKITCPNCGGMGCRYCSNGIIMPFKGGGKY